MNDKLAVGSGTPSRVSPAFRSGFSLYALSLCLAALACAFLDLGNYLYVISGGRFLPRYAYLGIVFASFPLIVLRPKALPRYFKSPFLAWCMAFAMLTLIHSIALLANGNSGAAAVAFTRVQNTVLAMSIGFVVANSPAKATHAFLIALALLLSSLQIYDFFNPSVIVPSGTEGVVLGRAASTLVNPNKAGESLVLLGVLALPGLRPVLRPWLMLGILPGVLLTFSRSALLVWALLFCIALVSSGIRVKTLITVATAVLVVGVLHEQLVDFLVSSVDSSAEKNILARLNFFSSLDLTDDSATERADVAKVTIQTIYANPFFGAGAGITQVWTESSISAHNEHLLVLAEYGIVGYWLLIWLFILVYRGSSYFSALGTGSIRRAAFVAVMGFTPFTHNMFDNFYWLATFAIAAQDQRRTRTGSRPNRRMPGAKTLPNRVVPTSWSSPPSI